MTRNPPSLVKLHEETLPDGRLKQVFSWGKLRVTGISNTPSSEALDAFARELHRAIVAHVNEEMRAKTAVA